MLLRHLKIPLGITALALVLTFIFAGPEIATIVAILVILEVSLSFDNAVVNAKVLGRMSEFWQKIFLTVGIAIAVFGMRLVFPIAIVAIAASLGPIAVLQMALSDPNAYAEHVLAAHGVIAGFGGMFLFMIFLDFLFEEREIRWIKAIEDFTSGPYKEVLTLGVGAATTVILYLTYGESVGGAALAGYLTWVGITWITQKFETNDGEVKTLAKAGFASFMYLELLDASFSFDGVTGAFAVSNQIFVIALGLGLGALFVRSLTVYLVRQGTLSEYRYLEHGAHYAIGALAILLFASIAREIPEVVTGLIGVGFIIVAFTHSILENRRESIKA